MKMSLIRFVVLSAAAGALLSTFAAPEISNVAQSRNDETHLVTISYDLSEDAIVTAQVLVNGEKLSPDAYGTLAGKVHRVVAAGTERKIWWKAPAGLAANAEVKLSAWAKDDPPDYMAVDMITGSHWRFFETAEDVPGGVTNRLYKTDKLLMRKIYAKDIQWPMGTSSDRLDGTLSYSTNTSYWVQHAPHMVTLTENYYIGVYELTKRQYANVLDRTFVRPENITVNDVRPTPRSWDVLRGHDANYVWPGNGHNVPSSTPIGAFRKLTGLQFDLPTEAQWEYACRAGEAKNLYTGEALTDAAVDEIAWHYGNYANDPMGEEGKTHEVGLLAPNRWGLYDMLGNGAELCLDVMASGTGVNADYYKGADAVDPVGPSSGTEAGSQGRHARRGSGITNSLDKAKTTYLSCRADLRTSVKYTAGYAENAVRLVVPATIP